MNIETLDLIIEHLEDLKDAHIAAERVREGDETIPLADVVKEYGLENETIKQLEIILIEMRDIGKRNEENFIDLKLRLTILENLLNRHVTK